MYQKGTTIGSSLGNGHIENWGESGMADNSQQTDTSTDVDTDDKNQVACLFLDFILCICLVFCKMLCFFYLYKLWKWESSGLMVGHLVIENQL